MGVFLRNRPRKICGREPLKSFSWPIFEYFDSHISRVLTAYVLPIDHKSFEMAYYLNIRKWTEEPKGEEEKR